MKTPSLFPGHDDLPMIPAEVLALLSPSEIALARTMPDGAQWARIVGWLRKNPRAVQDFIAETRVLLTETPRAKIAVEEVLCRLRRRHGIHVSNHKGFFARWLPHLVPGLQGRVTYRQSKYTPFFNDWRTGE